MIFENGRARSSYSQIDKYLQCPYSWFLNYGLQRKSSKKHKALEYGLVIHETLEIFFERLKAGEMMPYQSVSELYEFKFLDHQIPFDNDDERMEYFVDGLNAVKRLYKPETFAERVMVERRNEILGVEHQFEISFKVDNLAVGYLDEYGDIVTAYTNEVVVLGFIDLVIRTPDGIVLIDHKSGKKPFDKKKLQTNLQFPLYNMAIQNMYGELPFASHYNFTKIGESQSVVATKDRIEESRYQIIEVFERMSGGFHPANPTPLCYWCDYGFFNTRACTSSSKFRPKQKASGI